MKVIKIKLDNPSKINNGIFEGWGTSLCWWANRIGYSSLLTEKAAELFFSENGLNLNIMRYNIGGGDDPTHSHIRRTDSVIPGWLLYNPHSSEYTYNYNSDINQLNVLKACYKLCKKPLVEVFSNSPPYFMCKSGCSSGGENPNENNLKDEFYDAFADYLAHVTNYIQKELNIQITSLSPMNEPNTDYWRYLSEKQEGCHFDYGFAQNKLLICVKNAMEKYNLNNILLTASDETSTDKALLSYKNYKNEIKVFLKRINTHTYGTNKMCELSKILRKDNKNIWMSESDWGDISGENAEEMGAGLWLAEKIIKDINNLSPSAWVLWQTIDYHKSENGYMGNKDFGIPDTTKGYWGLAFADHDTNEIILTKKYYCMGQFTKHINPGDTILHIDETVLCAANNREIKLVTVNSNASQIPLEIDLKDIKKQINKVKQIRTSGNMVDGENGSVSYKNEISNNIFKTDLKENSVTTFIFEY